jgi:MoaA/NifB/PqqE/SkfB family radical SAM enzyme
MSWYKNLHKLQLDPTSHCNARCGACARNIYGGETRHDLELKHFDLELWKRIAIEDTKECYINHLSLNGNWGDALMHPDIIEIIEIWNTYHPESEMAIATNGSLRSTEFWKKLANVLRNTPRHSLEFSMDGMEDTHHIYRRKTSHSKLVDNIKTFVDAGGTANIYMTLFEHNKHQIKEVANLSKELGADGFYIRHSHRSKMKIIDGEERYDIEGYFPKIIKGSFTFPKNKKINSDARDSKIHIQNNEKIKPNTTSKCPWKQQHKVQIDPWGIIWPCCYVSKYGGGGSMTGFNMDEIFSPGNDNIINNVFEQNDVNKYTLKEILENKWFNTTVDNAIAKSEWNICNETCGI